MESRQSGRNQTQDFWRYFVFGKVEEIGPERVGDNLVEFAPIDEPAIDQGLFDAFAVQARLLQDLVDLRSLEDALVDEEIRDLLAVHRLVLGGSPGVAMMMRSNGSVRSVWGELEKSDGAGFEEWQALVFATSQI
jgi:hypothetical protein